MNKIYDFIIVGSGISGLYSALCIMKYSPSSTFLILEKYKKKWIGGRWGNELFHGVKVVSGAGVGRKEKDKLLIKLMKELHISAKEEKVKINYAFENPVDILKVTNFLRLEYKKRNPKKHLTFEQFAREYLSSSDYKRFLTSAGYTDYEKEDVKDVLTNYGMDDNVGGWTAMMVPWKEMVDKLVDKIGSFRIKTSSKVISIDFIEKCLFQVDIENGSNYYCKKVIVATTIDGIRKLVPGAEKSTSIYNQIKGQPFLRLYAQFSKKSIPILKNFVPSYTIVEGPLQKIIPMDANKGIYMIAYSDNKNALFLQKYLKNTEKNRNIFCHLLEDALHIPENSLQILDMKDFYWPIGTHYYTPLSDDYSSRKQFLNEVQHPQKNMLVVGEAVSDDQGWSEGALRSVQEVVTKKWIEEKC
jgi:hypothetical protein